LSSQNAEFEDELERIDAAANKGASDLYLFVGVIVDRVGDGSVPTAIAAD
jgi:hypothetical protein